MKEKANKKEIIKKRKKDDDENKDVSTPTISPNKKSKAKSTPLVTSTSISPTTSSSPRQLEGSLSSDKIIFMKMFKQMFEQTCVPSLNRRFEEMLNDKMKEVTTELNNALQIRMDKLEKSITNINTRLGEIEGHVKMTNILGEDGQQAEDDEDNQASQE